VGKQQDVMLEDGWNATYANTTKDAPNQLLTSLAITEARSA